MRFSSGGYIGRARSRNTGCHPGILRLKGRFFWRNNSGAFKTERGGFYRIGTPGAPDIIGCFHGKFVALELKTVTVASFQMTRRRSPLVLFVLVPRHHAI